MTIIIPVWLLWLVGLPLFIVFTIGLILVFYVFVNYFDYWFFTQKENERLD